MNMNPMMLMQMLQGGGNPQQLMQMLLSQNPQAAQLMRSLQDKPQSELRQMAENAAKARGTTLEALAKQYGLPLK